MRDERESAAMRAALQFVLASDMPAEHKRVLIESVTGALRNKETAERDGEARQRESQTWQPDETTQLAAFLEGKVATGWQHADELLMQLAGQLHRSPRDVRSKATELGFGASVDYNLAKALVRPRND